VRKRLKKGIVPKETVKKANLIIPRPVAYAVRTSPRALKVSPQWPAVLARAAPMTPARGANEGGGEGASPPKGNPLGWGWGSVLRRAFS